MSRPTISSTTTLGLVSLGLLTSVALAAEPAKPQAIAASQATAVSERDIESRLQEFWFEASRSGHLPMLNEFVGAKYDLNTRDVNGYTALILAAYHGHEDAVDLLMRAGADSCAQDNRGNTALMGAVFKGETSIAAKLLGAPCDPNHRNTAGQTPAMYAALFGRLEMLQALKKRGADLNAVDAAGNSVESLSRGEVRTAPNGEVRRGGIP